MAADTQYLIDIAAQMTGGDKTISQLDALADRLAAAGSTAIDQALQQANAALRQTGTAAAEAASALSAGQARYNELERAADRAAKALEKAAVAGKSQDAHVLARNAHMAAQALAAEGQQLDALKTKAAAAAAAHQRVSGSLKHLEAAARKAAAAESAAMPTGKVNELAEGFGRLPGPIGRAGASVFGLADGMGKLKGSIGLVGTAAVSLLAAVGLLVVGIVAAVAATAKWAIGLADAARSSKLATAALEQTSERLAGLGSIMPSVSRATGIAAADLRDLAKQLDDAKVTAADMPAALRAVALAEKALGKGGAAKFIAQLKDGKTNVSKLAAEMEKKFGGIVAKQLLSLDDQTDRLKQNLAETFGGLKIDGLLESLKLVVGFFDQSTASGKTLKFLFEELFQPIIDGIQRVAPVAEAFWLGAAIGALKLYIAMKPAIKGVAKLFGSKEPGLESSLDLAAKAGQGLVMVIGFIGIGAAAVFTGAAAVVMGLGAAFSAIGSAASAVWNAIKSAAKTAIDYLSNTSLSQIGTDMVTGLAKGITSAASAVLKAITGVVLDSIEAAKKLLDSDSPSKVFMGIGSDTALGFAMGVEDGSPGAQSALETMVDPPEPATAATAAGSGGRARAFVLNGNIIINGVKNAEHAAELLEERLTSLFEGDALQLGGELEPAT